MKQHIIVLAHSTHYGLQHEINNWREHHPDAQIQHVAHACYQGPLVDGCVETGYSVVLVYVDQVGA